MKCLCCNKEISKNALPIEKKGEWHYKCIKEFFGASKLFEHDVSNIDFLDIVNENTKQGVSVSGAQKKISFYLSNNKKIQSSLSNLKGYLIKPQVDEYIAMPKSEFLVMHMAKITGIKVVPFALIKLNDEYTYITKRIDRINGTKLAMEDFCQLDEKLTLNKYDSSYERCGKIIKRYSSRVNFDLSEFFLRLVFCFVIGNSDMHLKNFSLIETSEGSQTYILSDAYDLLPVNVVFPLDKEEVALTLNGKKQNLRRKDFLELANNIGLVSNVAIKIIDKVVGLKDTYIKMNNDSYLPANLKELLLELITKRINILEKR